MKTFTRVLKDTPFPAFFRIHAKVYEKTTSATESSLNHSASEDF